MSRRLSLGVLVSGSGTNLQAILDAAAQPASPFVVRVVISNRPRVQALERAARAQVESLVISHRKFAARQDFEQELVKALQQRGVELVALAGFMRLLTGHFLQAFPGKVVNIHPGLLPAFPGLHAQQQALEQGVKIAGCTVHFVDQDTDSGPIIGQAAVSVLDTDDEEQLARRILEQEHRLYPLVLRLIAEGRVTLEGRRVRIAGSSPGLAALINPWLPCPRTGT